MIDDIRLALRSLPRMPRFSLAFILTLGLGIGANTAIFSVINGVLLRPLPYPDADRIVHLRQAQTAAGIENANFSFPEVADYRAQSKTLDQFVEFGDWTFNVLGHGDPHRAQGGLVTANFFQMLGARARLGRVLLPTDEGKGVEPVAVLTDAYWQRVFGADPSAVGQMLDLTVTKARIVGVLGPGSHYATQRRQDFYVNYAANDHYMSASMQNERVHRMTDVYARLVPGATAGAAQAEARQIAARLHEADPAAYPKPRGFDTVVTPWKDELTAKAKPTLMILLVTTIFVLVIACANVANLTLDARDCRVEHHVLHRRPAAEVEGRRVRHGHALRRDSGNGTASPDSDQQEPRGDAARGASAGSPSPVSRRETGPRRPVVSAHRRSRRGDAADRTSGVNRSGAVLSRRSAPQPFLRLVPEK